jgi:hypothetical protein
MPFFFNSFKFDLTFFTLHICIWALLEMLIKGVTHHLLATFEGACHYMTRFQMLKSLFIFETVLRWLAYVSLAPVSLVRALESFLKKGLLCKSVHCLELRVFAAHWTILHSTFLHVLNTVRTKQSLAHLAFLRINHDFKANCTREICVLFLGIMRILS